LGGLLSGDVIIGNLECPLAHHQPEIPQKADGGPNLRGDPEMADWLRQAGFSVLSLANNHAMDCGPAGLAETIQTLRRLGIQPVGAGQTLQQAIKPVIVEAKGLRVALLAFGNGESASPHQPGVATINTRLMRKALRTLPSGLDARIVIMHTGLEFLPYPESWTRQFARDAIDAGADAVIGGHSHCLRGVELHRGKPIFYGLGDFLADTADPEHLAAHVERTALARMGFPIANPLICRQGMVVKLVLNRGWPLAWKVQPVALGEDFLPALPAGSEAEDLRRTVQELSDALRDDGPALRQVRAIERAYRHQFGGGRSWKRWLLVPLRAARRLPRILGGRA
jgi:poly-gamma-glutamate capsule biosynthesis protein CapA/YwtB (metallophosphatase superfamily)